MVFYFAGVFLRGFGGYAYADEKGGQKRVALVDLFGDSPSAVGQRYKTVFIDDYIIIIAKNAERAGYAGLGKLHFFGNVYRADFLFLFAEEMYRFEIHFARFLNFHN